MVLPIAYGKKFSQEFHKDRSWVLPYLTYFSISIEGNYFTNYADDTTPYVIGNNAEEVVSELKAITQNYSLGLPKTK